MDWPESGFGEQPSGRGERRQSPARGTAWGGDQSRAFASAARETGDPALLVSLADRRVVEVNDAFSREVGRHPADLVGLTLERAMPRANAQALQALLDALRLHRVADVDVELLRDGSRVRQRALGMSPDGEIAMIRLRSLEVGRAGERGALDQGMMARDLDHVLASVSAGCDTLLGRSLASDVRAGLEEIRGATARAATLAQRLLARERPAETASETTDLYDVVGDVLPFLQRLLGARVQLDVRLSGGALPVLADRGELGQLVLDLAADARGAMPEGGRLIIETDACELDAQACVALGASAGAGCYARLRVGDSGVRRDEETRTRVSEARITTAPAGEGTGLARVRAIATRLGGGLSATSAPGAPGAGSTIAVHVPLARPGARITVAPARRPVVLLTDDEAPLRSLGRRILERAGFEVREAASGEAGLRIAEAEAVDVLVTDVILPAMRGRELAQRVASLRPGVGVLFMSGYTSDDVSLGDMLAAGALFLEKPFAPGTLVARVRQLLEQAARAH